MNTIIDFTNAIKGVEYLIAIGFFVAFLLLWQVFKAKPLGVVAEAKADLGHIRLRSVLRLLAAPFIGLAYMLALPFVMVYGLSSLLVEAAGKALGHIRIPTLVFGYRPQMAWLLRNRK